MSTTIQVRVVHVGTGELPAYETLDSAGMDLPSYLKGNGNNGAPVEVLEDVTEEPKKKDKENNTKESSSEAE